MGIIDRAKKAIGAFKATPPSTGTTDTRTNLRRMQNGYFPWMQEMEDRKHVEDIISRMDEEDEIVSAGLDAIAYCATTFVDATEDREIIVESSNPKVLKILTDMHERTGFQIRFGTSLARWSRRAIISVRWS